MKENGDIHLGYSKSIIEEDEKRSREAEESQAERLREEASHFVYDEHSGRVIGAGLAQEKEGELYTPRMDMRAAYNNSDFNISSENKSFLERISDGGRKIFDGLLKIPGINKVAAKFGMKYEQFWLDRSNEKTKDLGSKVQSLDLQIMLRNRRVAALKSKEETNFIRAKINEMRLQSQINEIGKLEGDRDKLMAKIGAHEAGAKLYAQKRDGVADWLIDFYGEKVSPLETELQTLEDGLKKFDSDNEPMEQQFAEWSAEIVKLEGEKKEYVQELAESGMSSRKINKEVAFFGEQIKELRAELRKRDNLKERRALIQKKIAKAKEKLVNADKRKEYINAKNSKALIITPEKAAAPAIEQVVEDPNRRDGEISSDRADHPENAVENVETEKFDIGKTLEKWNEYIVKELDPGFHVDPKIAVPDLVKRMGIKEDEPVDVTRFKEIIRGFYDKRYKGKALKEGLYGSWDKFAKIGGSLVKSEKVAENNQAVDISSEVNKADGVPENVSPENAENRAYKADDIVGAWNIFTRKNAGADMHADLTVGLADLMKENKDLGNEINLEIFKEAITKFFVTNNLGGDQYKKIVEQSLENFSKNIGEAISEAQKKVATKNEENDAEVKDEGSPEQAVEDQKIGIEEFGRQWNDFIADRLRNKDLLINPDELKTTDGVPADGLVNIKQFKATLSYFYGIKFDISKRIKPDLMRAIDDFLEGGREQ